MIYSIDTSALVKAWCEAYKPSTFPPIWKNLEAMIGAGTLIATEEVLHELTRKDDDLYAWARKHVSMFQSMDPSIEAAVRSVAAIPNAVSEDSPTAANWADPFVIALAVARSGTVVTSERTGGPAHPKVPYLCGQLGVACQSLEDFVNSQGWVIG